MRRSLLVVTLISAVVLSLMGQTDDASTSDATHISGRTLFPDDVASLAIQSSSAIVTLQRNLEDAMEAIGWEAYRDDLGIALSGAVSGTSIDSISTSAGASVGFDIDLIPQLRLTSDLGATFRDPVPSAGYDIIDGTVGIEFTPLADTSGNERDELEVAIAEYAISNEIREQSFSAIVQLFDAVRAASQIALLESDLDLAERHQMSVIALRDRDRATDAQVEAANDAVRTADQARRRGAFDLTLELNTLGTELGVPVVADQLPALKELGLADAVTMAEGVTNTLDEELLVLESDSVMEAWFALSGELVDTDDARVFDPSAFSLTASVGSSLTQASEGASPEITDPLFSLSFQLSMNGSNFDHERVTRAEEDVAQAELALDAATRAASLALQSALLDLEIAVENASAEERDVTIAEQDLREAEFLLGRGELTQLAYDETAVALEAARLERDLSRLAVVQQLYLIELIQF